MLCTEYLPSEVHMLKSSPGSLDNGYLEAPEKGNLGKNRQLSGSFINIWDVQAVQGGSCAKAQKMAVTYKLRKETQGGPSPASCYHVCQEIG